MNSLEQMFPSLTLFSDLNWDKVKTEYESEYSDLSFPEYLQQKCIEGDCPPYLFELAFFVNWAKQYFHLAIQMLFGITQ